MSPYLLEYFSQRIPDFFQAIFEDSYSNTAYKKGRAIFSHKGI